MERRKLTQYIFVLTILGILLLLLLSQIQKPITEGTITSVEVSQEQTKILISKDSRELIFFEPLSSEIQINKKVIVYGKEESYRGKKQILVDKIELSP